MEDSLTSLYHVRVTVLGANVSRFANYRTEKLADEMKKQLQSKVLRETDKNLKEFGVKVAEENVTEELQCTFSWDSNLIYLLFVYDHIRFCPHVD